MGKLYSTPMSRPEPAPHPGAARIDRWLFAVRLFRSRALAAQAVTGGRVHVNGERVKPARELRIGDQLTVMRGAVEFACQVVALPARRGPAAEAQAAYAETADSQARRAAFSARLKVAAALTPRPRERPDKHARAQLRRLRGRI
jgi:ribosome-associated heat shock protein Hsp15